MDTLQTTLSLFIAVVMIATAAHFIWRQWRTLRSLDPHVPSVQRRYLVKQVQRRLFGSFLLILLAGMLVGSSFLDYELVREPFENLPPEDQEAAKQAFRFISIYWMTFLLLLLAMMALAVVDLWATARHGVRLQKQLFLEHQEMLEAELAEHRQRRAEMN